MFEQDLPFVEVGSESHIEVSAYPGEHLMGRVSFVYPTVDVTSRTNRVRVTVPNPGLRLKPGMFATIFLDAGVGRDVLAVPLEAVIVTGERNLVFVRRRRWHAQPREVVLGARPATACRSCPVSSTARRSSPRPTSSWTPSPGWAARAAAMPGMQHGAGRAGHRHRRPRGRGAPS